MGSRDTSFGVIDSAHDNAAGGAGWLRTGVSVPPIGGAATGSRLMKRNRFVSSTHYARPETGRKLFS